jgi:type IV pilus assembly protein PilQ
MNYIKGADVQKLLVDPKQTLLSKRGSALLDDRSNMLFVKDTASRLDDVREMIAKVDIPVRQVMIEARIVEAGDSFAKNLGVRLSWGGPTLNGPIPLVNGAQTRLPSEVTTPELAVLLRLIRQSIFRQRRAPVRPAPSA